MFPILFQVGPFALHTYGLLVALGVLAGIHLASAFAARDGFGGKQHQGAVYNLFLYVIALGLAGGRIAYVAFHWHEFVGDLAGVFKIWEGGLVSHGGLAGAFLGFALWHRGNRTIPALRACDWLAPSLAFGHALGRLGCLFAGCCYGKPAQVPWAIVFSDERSLAPLGVPLHPTQIYEFALLVSIGAFLSARLWRSLPSPDRVPGRIFQAYLALYGAGRFAIEFLRGDEPRIAGLTVAQYASLALIAAAFFLQLRLRAASPR